ncbi:hypothetical protein [Lelliottia amnigena]
MWAQGYWDKVHHKPHNTVIIYSIIYDFTWLSSPFFMTVVNRLYSRHK